MQHKKIKTVLFTTIVVMSLTTIKLFASENAVLSFVGVIPCLIIIWCMKKYNILTEKENQPNPQQQIEKGLNDLKEKQYNF